MRPAAAREILSLGIQQVDTRKLENIEESMLLIDRHGRTPGNVPLFLPALPGLLVALLVLMNLHQTMAAALPCNQFSMHTKVNEAYCLHGDDKGSVYMLDCSIDLHQLWELREFDNFTDLDGYKAKMFQNIATGRYLRHTRYADWNEVDTYAQTSDQTMWVMTNDEGSYCFNIRTYLSRDLYLDVDHATPQGGGLRLYNRLIIFQGNSGANQKFVLKPLCKKIH